MRLTQLVGYDLSLSTKFVTETVVGPDRIQVIPAHISIDTRCYSRDYCIELVNKFFDEVERNRKLLQ